VKTNTRWFKTGVPDRWPQDSRARGQNWPRCMLGDIHLADDSSWGSLVFIAYHHITCKHTALANQAGITKDNGSRMHPAQSGHTCLPNATCQDAKPGTLRACPRWSINTLHGSAIWKVYCLSGLQLAALLEQHPVRPSLASGHGGVSQNAGAGGRACRPSCTYSDSTTGACRVWGQMTGSYALSLSLASIALATRLLLSRPRASQMNALAFSSFGRSTPCSMP
jgi:hypothetical protein